MTPYLTFYQRTLTNKNGIKVMKRDFFMVVEKDEDGFYVGEIPSLRACYAQGKTMEELLSNIREVIELCLEDDPEAIKNASEFIGVQKVTMDLAV